MDSKAVAPRRTSMAGTKYFDGTQMVTTSHAAMQNRGQRSILENWIQKHNFRQQALEQRRSEDDQLRRIGIQMFIISLVGVLLMIAHEEMMSSEISPDKLNLDEECVEGHLTRRVLLPLKTDSALLIVLDVLIPLSSALLVWRLVVLYKLQAQQKMEAWFFPSRWKAFIGSSLKLKFCAELLICILQPLPTEYYKSGIEFSGDSWFRHMGLLMFLRSYIFVRILRDFSTVYRERHRIESNAQLPQRPIGFMLALKSGLQRSPIAILLLFLFLVVLIFNYCIYVLEREAARQGFQTTIDSYVKAMWFVIATLTTAGYGDVVPSVSKGYYIAIAEGLIALTATSTLVAVVIDKLTMSEDETKIVSWVNASRYKVKLEKHAVCALQMWWRTMLHARRAIRAEQASGESAAEDAAGGTLVTSPLYQTGGSSRSLVTKNKVLQKEVSRRRTMIMGSGASGPRAAALTEAHLDFRLRAKPVLKAMKAAKRAMEDHLKASDGGAKMLSKSSGSTGGNAKLIARVAEFEKSTNLRLKGMEAVVQLMNRKFDHTATLVEALADRQGIDVPPRPTAAMPSRRVSSASSSRSLAQDPVPDATGAPKDSGMGSAPLRSQKAPAAPTPRQASVASNGRVGAEPQVRQRSAKRIASLGTLEETHSDDQRSVPGTPRAAVQSPKESPPSQPDAGKPKTQRVASSPPTVPAPAAAPAPVSVGQAAVPEPSSSPEADGGGSGIWGESQETNEDDEIVDGWKYNYEIDDWEYVGDRTE